MGCGTVYAPLTHLTSPHHMCATRCLRQRHRQQQQLLRQPPRVALAVAQVQALTRRLQLA